MSANVSCCLFNEKKKEHFTLFTFFIRVSRDAEQKKRLEELGLGFKTLARRWLHSLGVVVARENVPER